MLLTEENDKTDKKKEEQPSEKTRNESKETKKASGKYVFECQKCGQCCENNKSVVVSLADLERWSNDLTLPSLYPYLTIELKGDDYIQVSLKKRESEDDEQQKGCPLYDEANKICNIYFSMPLYCSSFPLGYDGNNYFLKDKSCPGIGKGNMTEESLGAARKTAKDDFENRVSTSLLLPVIHGLTLGFILDQSKKRIDALSPEQKRKLNEILEKNKQEGET